MLASIDVETHGLNCKKFILGCLLKESNPQPITFHDPTEMWEAIIKLGKAERKRGHTLTIYGHNILYDFYAIAKLEDPNIKYHCLNPFITDYVINGKVIIKFLDTYQLYRMPLEQLGETIGIEKKEMPKELLDENKTKEELNLTKIQEYCERDVLITLKSVQYLKKLIKRQGMRINRLMTINQIGIQYLLKKIKELPQEIRENIFWDEKRNETRRTFRKEEIHQAYRGGRVEAFKTGQYKSTTCIDINSLYPFSAIKMKFPDLRTERITWKPLKMGIKKEEIIKKIGLSKVLIKNISNNIGLLPIRTNTNNYYPKDKKVIVGTYTHQELEQAINHGYEIEDIEWSITFEEAENPFQYIFPDLYEKKETAKTPAERLFYKNMANCGIGKLAQQKTALNVVIDTIDEAEKYIKQNYEMVHGIDNTMNVAYQKENKTIIKPYYTPIIPTLINATARTILNKELMKLPPEDLLYCDTDSIIFKGDHLNNFVIGKEIGQFKVEFINEDITIYGRKTYATNTKIAVSGIRKKDITKKLFEEGTLTTKKMITHKTTNDHSLIGTFKTETRDLHKQHKDHRQTTVLLQQENIYVDKEIKEINYFLPKLLKTAKSM